MVVAAIVAAVVGFFVPPGANRGIELIFYFYPAAEKPVICNLPVRSGSMNRLVNLITGFEIHQSGVKHFVAEFEAVVINELLSLVFTGTNGFVLNIFGRDFGLIGEIFIIVPFQIFVQVVYFILREVAEECFVGAGKSYGIAACGKKSEDGIDSGAVTEPGVTDDLPEDQADRGEA